MTANLSKPSASGTGHDRVTEVVRRAAEVVNATSFTAAYRWNGAGAAAPIRVDDQPEGIASEAWFERSVAPIMIRFLTDVGAPEAVTILDWNDEGIILSPASITKWTLLVRDAWDRYRLPVLLVSGCGYAGATAAVTSLVQPYGDPGNWFHYRRRTWRAPRWNRRTDAIVFRGSTTGNPSEALDEPLALALPRTRALLALQESELPADVTFSKVVQAAPGKQLPIEALFRERRILAQEMSMRAMMNYRYQLMIDGNHGAWTAHVWKLLSGSTNLWVESRARNWFDGSFKPWTHYIPVRADGLDLVDRYSAIREDAPMARRIAKACRSRARKVFTRRFMLRVQRQQWLAAWRSVIEGVVVSGMALGFAAAPLAAQEFLEVTQRVALPQVVAAMQIEADLGYHLGISANSPRLTTSVIRTLVDDFRSRAPEGPPLFIHHDDWYAAFRRSRGCPTAWSRISSLFSDNTARTNTSSTENE